MSAPSLLLSGRWENSYGSLMDISVSVKGHIVGTYASTTGASGRYWVIGSCTPIDPSAQMGQSVVIAIYWRPIDTAADDATYNASWHWVSTYCGQLHWLETASGQRSLELSVVNSLVAPTPYDGNDVGDYIDKITFTKSDHQGESESSGLRLPELKMQKLKPNTLNGRWANTTQTVELDISVDSAFGWLSGLLTDSDQAIPILGFTDTLPLTSSGIRQSVTLCSWGDGAHIQPISLSGYLDLATDTLIVTAWRASGTSIGDAYLQANASALILMRQ
ncbi:avidin/streptavidin family protein [Celerinatantimonas yamalensis]|uniref:Avidin/streptavidin family protein n=1 Tax=Celerinatantimonas yamalensis TaxID=559956 RepID=A0ABW9GBV4_9GAMM